MNERRYKVGLCHPQGRDTRDSVLVAASLWRQRVLDERLQPALEISMNVCINYSIASSRHTKFTLAIRSPVTSHASRVACPPAVSGSRSHLIRRPGAAS